MLISYSNLNWMSLNIFLACAGLIFGLLFLYAKNFYLKIVLVFLWILFLPNTIYLITDLQHFPRQFYQTNLLFDKVFLFIQYIFLFTFGIFSYLYGMYPLQILFPVFRRRQNPLFVPIVLVINFAIAFGVTMGKIERTHSLYLFTDPLRVLTDAYNVLTFPPTLGFTVLFWLLINLIFFAFYTISVKLLKLK